MGTTLQNVLVGVAAMVAAVWLIRRRLVKKRSCADCALADAVARRPVEGSGSLEERAR
jgi:hypothetical protein